jgi:predicted RNA polymerase sigma factor
VRGPDAPTRKTIETVWRIEAARLIGGLVRFVRSVDRAEDLAQEALLSALVRWPETGIPVSQNQKLYRSVAPYMRGAPKVATAAPVAL